STEHLAHQRCQGTAERDRKVAGRERGAEQASAKHRANFEKRGAVATATLTGAYRARTSQKSAAAAISGEQTARFRLKGRRQMMRVFVQTLTLAMTFAALASLATAQVNRRITTSPDTSRARPSATPEP